MPLAVKVSGKRLGIVGLGRIGTAVARRAAGFGMEIAYTDIVVKGCAPYDFVPRRHHHARLRDFLPVSGVRWTTTTRLNQAAVLDLTRAPGMGVGCQLMDISVDQVYIKKT